MAPRRCPITQLQLLQTNIRGLNLVEDAPCLLETAVLLSDIRLPSLGPELAEPDVGLTDVTEIFTMKVAKFGRVC